MFYQPARWTPYSTGYYDYLTNSELKKMQKEVVVNWFWDIIERFSRNWRRPRKPHSKHLVPWLRSETSPPEYKTSRLAEYCRISFQIIGTYLQNYTVSPSGLVLDAWSKDARFESGSGYRIYENFRGFPQPIQENTGIISWLRHERFRLSTFQFIIHLSFIQ
jgi:hypothetical protein